MTQKHWCMRAARERQEGVKTHRYAVLKGCREWDIVRPPTLLQITPELPTVTVFIPTLQEIWSDPAKNSAVMTVMTSTPRSHLITAVKRYCGYRHSPSLIPSFFQILMSLHHLVWILNNWLKFSTLPVLLLWIQLLHSSVKSARSVLVLNPGLMHPLALSDKSAGGLSAGGKRMGSRYPIKSLKKMLNCLSKFR